MTEPGYLQSVSLDNQYFRNCALGNSVQDRFWNVLDFCEEWVFLLHNTVVKVKSCLELGGNDTAVFICQLKVGRDWNVVILLKKINERELHFGSLPCYGSYLFVCSFLSRKLSGFVILESSARCLGRDSDNCISLCSDTRLWHLSPAHWECCLHFTSDNVESELRSLDLTSRSV